MAQYWLRIDIVHSSVNKYNYTGIVCAASLCVFMIHMRLECFSVDLNSWEFKKSFFISTSDTDICIKQLNFIEIVSGVLCDLPLTCLTSNCCQ